MTCSILGMTRATMIESRYFKHNELQCSHCGLNKMQKPFLLWMDSVREEYGSGLVVTSAYRCPEHNKAVSSTGLTGPHTTGQAMDIAVDRGEAYKIIQIAMNRGVRGLGVNQKGDKRFIHLDLLDSGRPTVWSY